MMKQDGIEWKYYRIQDAKIIKPEAEEFWLVPTPQIFTYIHPKLYIKLVYMLSSHKPMVFTYLAYKIRTRAFNCLGFIQIS